MNRKVICALLAPFFFACTDIDVKELGSEWKSIERDLQTQLITSEDSVVIDLPEGHFMFKRSLSLD
ncbi:MAG: hypothetical protein ACI8WP_001752, partial [Flavobacteriaceae bacterium]